MLDRYCAEQDPYREFRERAQQPKSQETREQMSQAKLGVAKTAEHRKKMRETHLRLHHEYLRIKNETGCSYREAKIKWSQRKEKMITALMADTGHSRRACWQWLKDQGMF